MIALSNATKLAIMALVFLSTSGEAQTASLRGSKSAMAKQNEEADKERLSRIKDDKQIAEFVRDGLLVPLPNNKNVVVSPVLPADRRYARPWTVKFLENLGAAYHQKFGKSIQVNSAVRDVETQGKLSTHNRNAAAASGPLASSHLTGATVDIQHRSMTPSQKQWVEAWLLERENKGWLQATEEHRQAVFHVMVFKTYGTPPAKAKKHPRR